MGYALNPNFPRPVTFERVPLRRANPVQIPWWLLLLVTMWVGPWIGMLIVWAGAPKWVGYVAFWASMASGAFGFLGLLAQIPRWTREFFSGARYRLWAFGQAVLAVVTRRPLPTRLRAVYDATEGSPAARKTRRLARHGLYRTVGRALLWWLFFAIVFMGVALVFSA